MSEDLERLRGVAYDLEDARSKAEYLEGDELTGIAGDIDALHAFVEDEIETLRAEAAAAKEQEKKEREQERQWREGAAAWA